jgi:hypothetical protein
VTLGCIALNLCWLLPLAWLAHRMPRLGLVCVLIAYVPVCLGVLAVLLRDGRASAGGSSRRPVK